MATMVEREGMEAGLRWWASEGGLPGTLCGYVEVPEGHPWRSAEGEYDDVIPDEAHEAVNGGLTAFGDGYPGPGQDEWVVGFDCAHAFNLRGGVQMGADDVERDCRALARIVAKEAPDAP